MVKKNTSALHQHLVEVKEGKRCFENAFQGVARMILDSDIEKVVVNGKTTYDFSIFRTGKKHIIGMYDEINSFVSYVKDAAENGLPKKWPLSWSGNRETARLSWWILSAINTGIFCPRRPTANILFGLPAWTKSAGTAKYDHRVPDL
jgi:hypothetical protein